jgi:hypothetical protein
MVRCVWALQKEEVTKYVHCLEERSARDWLANMIDTPKLEDHTRGFVTLWAIWHARRKPIHEQIFQSPLSTHHFIENFIADLQLAPGRRAGPSETGRPGGGSAPSCIPPLVRLVKINVHAAMGKNTGIAALAAIARNEQGLFLGASSITLQGKSNPELLEVLACREAVALASDIDVRVARVASDFLAAVKMIHE